MRGGCADLFVTFFKVGAFTIGGGYAMIPLMQREVVECRQWATAEEFLDMVSVAQAMPGVFAVNMATMVGYRRRGVGGSVAAIVGCVLMPVILIIALAMGIGRVSGNSVLEHLFMGIRPAVVALMVVPVVTLAKVAGVSWRTCWIPVVCALAVWLAGVSPLVVIIVAAAVGLLQTK